MDLIDDSELVDSINRLSAIKMSDTGISFKFWILHILVILLIYEIT
jgi:hypothetical protein